MASMASGSARTVASKFSRSGRCAVRDHWSQIRRRGDPASATSFPHAPTFDVERFQIGLQEELQRVIRRLDDRLAGTVERGVEDDGHTGKRLETAQKPMEGAAVLVDSLDT